MCSRIVTASAEGVTLATDPEKRPPPRPPPPPPAGFRRDVEAPQHRLRERVLDRLALEQVAAARAERLIGLDEQDARPDALEQHHASAAALAAIEADVVRAEAGRQAGGHQD